MNKKIIDSCLFIGTILLMALYVGINNVEDIIPILVSMITLILLVVFTLLKQVDLRIVFIIVYISEFIIFSLGFGMVDMSSYILVGIITLIFSVFLTMAISYSRQKKMKDSLLIPWLHNKWPKLPKFVLFSINVIVYSVILIGFISLLNQSFNLQLYGIIIIFSTAISISDIYFLNKS